MKKTLYSLLCIVLAAVLLQACSKNDAIQPRNTSTLSAGSAASNGNVSILAVIPGAINPFTVLGHWANPASGASGFGSIPYNLTNNDSTHIPAQIRFTGFFNSYIVRRTTVPQTFLGYVDNTGDTSLNNLTLSYVQANYHTAFGVDSIGESAAYNSFQGYYTYDPVTHVPVTIKTRFVIVANNATIGSATLVYAIKVDALPAQQSGSLAKADVVGRYKQF
jgi:hypothetical protein